MHHNMLSTTPLISDNDQHLWSQIETHQQPTKVVLLGASNLSRSFPIAVHTALQFFQSPLAIHAAMGLGRSYGKESGFMGKKFSGIFSSSIWQSLSSENNHRTFAFVTDVGNDLAYEEPVDVVFEWVKTCVEQLNNMGAPIVLTGLPIEVLRQISLSKFYLMRAVLFPSCRLSLDSLLGRVQELDARLREFAESQKTPIFSVPSEWYGFDPIHPRATYMANYWRELFARLPLKEQSLSADHSRLVSRWRLRFLSTPGIGSKAPWGTFLPSQLSVGDALRISLH
jgi:hypothetical protein